MAGGSFEINQAGIDNLGFLLEEALEPLGERIAESARSFAPVGKRSKRGGNRDEHEVRVKVFRVAGGGRRVVPRRTSSASVQRSINAFNAAGGKPGPGSRLKLQKTRHGYVAVFGESGRDAHIKSSIRAEIAAPENGIHRVVIRANAKHALYQEQGFDHKGGTHVTGSHYMVKGLEAHRQEITSGAFIKKG